LQVRIFDDRIEIWGVGPLPKPLTLKDLVKKHDSVLRNQLIAKSLFMIKYIEQWGRGTNRIIEACVNHGLPQPLFEILSGGLVVTFRKDIFSERDIDQLDINDRQKKVLRYLKKHDEITNSDYQKINDVSKPTATRELSALVDKGLITRHGKTGRETGYFLQRK
jgi:ATP-dependent DNA helicase RecG